MLKVKSPMVSSVRDVQTSCAADDARQMHVYLDYAREHWTMRAGMDHAHEKGQK
jgi:hypothetical protein